MIKKALFCASRISHIEHFHMPYLQELQNRGYEVHVASEGLLDPGLGIQCYSMSFDKQLNPISVIKTVLQLRKLIRQNQYQLISTHTTLAAALCRSAYLLVGARGATMIYTCHGYLFDTVKSLKGFINLSCEKILAFTTDELVTMNREDFKIAEKFRLGRHIHFSMGMGLIREHYRFSTEEEQKVLRKSLQVSATEKVFLCVGEFSKRKNQMVLIEAAGMLKDEACKYIFLGEGTYLDACCQRAEQLGIANHCIFRGHVRDVSPYYSICDCVLSASKAEGLPLNIMEALYFSRPVIASNIKGHADLLEGQAGCHLFALDTQMVSCVAALLKIFLASDTKLEAPFLGEQYFYSNASQVHLQIYLESLKNGGQL